MLRCLFSVLLVATVTEAARRGRSRQGSEQESEPVDLVVGINSWSGSSANPPSGYLREDTNKGFGGKYIYIKPRVEQSVTGIQGFEFRQHENPTYVGNDRVTGDLAEGNGGNYRYIVPVGTAPPESAVKRVWWQEGRGNNQGNCTGDINSGRGGRYLYLCWSNLASPKLKFPANGGGFKILQIADAQVRSFATDTCNNVASTHWRHSGCNAYTTTQFITRLLEAESPDFVVFSGDNINGSPDGAETHSLLFAPVIAAGIPFASVFGNHDEEGQMNRREMIDYVVSRPYSLVSVGPNFESDHTGNYMLQIEASNSSNPGFNLWFIDSGSYAPISGRGTYDWVQADQISWYRQQSELSEQAAGRKLDSMAFFHIPTPEWQGAAAGPIVGVMQEGIYSPDYNSGMMDVMKERGDVRAASVGHDHVNDWCGVWQGIDLCYGGGVGYTTYGKTGWDRRARLFKIHEDGRIESWKRLDDRDFSIIDEQDLNGTAQGDDPNLRGYRGTQSVTRSGRTCQKWSSQSPHTHDRTEGKYPWAGVGDHNHCRNPDGEPTIWCYTLDSDSRWEYCDPEPGWSMSTADHGTVPGCNMPAKPTTATLPDYCK